MQDHLERMTRDFNRKMPRGMLSISMNLKKTYRPKPLTIREDLLRELACSVCQRSYGVYAIALFCPDCGAPNAAQHFGREVHLVAEQIDVADEKNGQGRRELAYRLMGNAQEDVVTAFETTLKTIFRFLVRRDCTDRYESLCSQRVTRNAFQNVDRAKELFENVNVDPFASLDAGDLEFLRLNIQKRHVIGHNLGIVDDSYAQLTNGDKPGETVALLGDEITRFAKVCLDIVTHLDSGLISATH